MKKKIIVFIVLIFLILTVLYVYSNRFVISKNIFNNEKYINVSLCGETYNVIDINVNGKYITRDLINETLKIDSSWCNSIYARNKDGLTVSHDNSTPLSIFIGYKGIEYEYILSKNSIYFFDMYAGDLGQKVLDLK